MPSGEQVSPDVSRPKPKPAVRTSLLSPPTTCSRVSRWTDRSA